MNRAFLSHSSKDKELVRQIAGNLGKARCVYDAFEFEAGMPIFDEIVKGIGNSDVFVLFISDNSLNSDWVKKEINEVKNLIDNGINKQFFPVLIDKSIVVSTDNRIPNWLKKYLLKPLTEPFLIKKKIEERLKDILYEKNPKYKAKERIFFGRKEVFEQFENKLYTVGSGTIKSIIVSGIDGIGRRSFLKKALQRQISYIENKEPIYISLGSNGGIESFILDLQDSISKDFLEQLSELDYDQKVDMAKELLKKVKDNNEYIFIIDDGCIIRPAKYIADWYLSIINDKEFENLFTLCVISRFKPSTDILRKNATLFIHFNIGALSARDTEKLFVKYCSELNCLPNQEQSNEILSFFNGIPTQVHYAVEKYILEGGIRDAIKNKKDISDFGDKSVISLINDIKDKGQPAFDLLVLLSHLGVVSYDLLYSIVGDTDDVNDLLEYFNVIGVYDLTGASKEYIKVHFPIQDYIIRSKSQINPVFQQKMKSNITEFIENESKIENYQDVSQLLFGIKGALIAGAKIDKRYYIPSYVLKTVVELYYAEDYNRAIPLIDMMLENPRTLGKDMERDFRFFLCQSLAKLSNERFETEVEYIDGNADKAFLKGFYYRIKKEWNLAQRYLNDAIKYNPNSQKAKRELSIVLMSINRLSPETLAYAKNNYKEQPNNPFHIQAYYICLTRKKYISDEDKITIEELIKDINKIEGIKAKHMATVMKGEYEYFINHDFYKAEAALYKCMNESERKQQATDTYKTLKEIYETDKMYAKIEKLEKEYKTVIDKINLYA